MKFHIQRDKVTTELLKFVRFFHIKWIRLENPIWIFHIEWIRLDSPTWVDEWIFSFAIERWIWYNIIVTGRMAHLLWLKRSFFTTALNKNIALFTTYEWDSTPNDLEGKTAMFMLVDVKRYRLRYRHDVINFESLHQKFSRGCKSARARKARIASKPGHLISATNNRWNRAAKVYRPRGAI